MLISEMSLSSVVFAQCQDRALCVDIVLDQEEFEAGAGIRGKVILYSKLPAVYPASVTVEVYKDGFLAGRNFTNIQKVFPGTTELSLKAFGLSEVNTTPEDAGDWRIVIIRKGMRGDRAEARFKTVSKQGKGASFPDRS